MSDHSRRLAKLERVAPAPLDRGVDPADVAAAMLVADPSIAAVADVVALADVHGTDSATVAQARADLEAAYEDSRAFIAGRFW